jgi:hypothetical protein
MSSVNAATTDGLENKACSYMSLVTITRCALSHSCPTWQKTQARFLWFWGCAVIHLRLCTFTHIAIAGTAAVRLLNTLDHHWTVDIHNHHAPF